MGVCTNYCSKGCVQINVMTECTCTFHHFVCLCACVCPRVHSLGYKINGTQVYTAVFQWPIGIEKYLLVLRIPNYASEDLGILNLGITFHRLCIHAAVRDVS